MEMNDLQPIILPGIPARRPLVIAGPCSAATEEQVLAAARALAAAAPASTCARSRVNTGVSGTHARLHVGPSLCTLTRYLAR